VDFKAIETKNQSNLKVVKSGSKIKYQYTLAIVNGKKYPVILIGAGHDPETVKQVTASKPFAGEIEVLREPVVGKGELKVTGCKSNRYEFETALARITKKKVFYV